MSVNISTTYIECDFATLQVHSLGACVLKTKWTRKVNNGKGQTETSAKIHQAITAYFSGKLGALNKIQLKLGGMSQFQVAVIKELRKTKPGKTISYSQLASKAGSPGASRAVGSVMANNPFPLIVPCHRVIRSDGKLGNYSGLGGTNLKAKLLNFESYHSS